MEKKWYYIDEMREKKEEWGERKKKKETRGNDSRVRKQSNTGSVKEMEMYRVIRPIWYTLKKASVSVLDR